MEIKTKRNKLEIGGIIPLDPKIYELNFDRLRFKIMKEEEWPEEKCIRAESQYRKWLTVKKENPNVDIVPSKFIDEFWHMHILDTYSYAKDCENVFGYFLHHYPYFGIYGKEDEQNLHDAFEETCKLYEERFGEKMDEEYDATRCEGHDCHSPSSCACRSPGACK